MSDLFTICIVLLVITGIYVALKEQENNKHISYQEHMCIIVSPFWASVGTLFFLLSIRLQVLITPVLKSFHTAL